MNKYNKHYVKRDPSGVNLLKEDGKHFDQEKGDKPNNCMPLLGEIAKPDCPLEDRHVFILNKDWNQTGIFYVKIENETKSDARLALEAEATELGITFRANIGDEKLQEKINEAIIK